MLIALWLPAAALGLVATTPASPPLRSVAAAGARTSSLEMRGGHAQSSPNTLMQPPDRQVGAPKEPQTEKAVGRLLSVELLGFGGALGGPSESTPIAVEPTAAVEGAGVRVRVGVCVW